MSSIIQIAICEKDKNISSIIISSMVENDFIPEFFHFDSVNELLDDSDLRQFDFFIINIDEFLVSEDKINSIKNSTIDSNIFVLTADCDEIECARLIKLGADAVLHPDSAYKTGKLLSKLRTIQNKISTKNAPSPKIQNVEYNLNWQIEKEIMDILKAESQLLESNLFQNTILDNIPNLIYVKDCNSFKFLYLNNTAKSMIGYAPEDMIGKNVYELFSRNYADYYNTKDIELLQKGTDQEVIEEMVLTRDNKLKIFLTRKIIIKDKHNQPKYLLGISEDLTDQYKTQEELRKSELRFSKIFHSSPIAIFIISEATKTFVDANTKFLDLIGQQRESLIGKKLNHIGKFFGDENIAVLDSVLESKSEFINNEIQIVSAGNQEVYLLMSHEKIDFSDESVSIFLGLDITQRKSAELGITTALEKQKELNKLKTHFISMISHEFRTPLTTIMLSTDLLSRYMDNWEKPERDKHFLRIKDTILKMTQLMENVLIIGRIESGKFYFNPEEADLSEFCFALTKNMEFSQSNTHKINLQFNGSCAQAFYDENLLGLILNNLLSNGIKYSPNAASVDFIVNCNNSIAEFIVKDYGIGIPEEDLNHMFQSFYRATNVGAIAGYGLGLSIVKKCVDTHNGTIEIRSRVGEGTTFIVRIPTKKYSIVR